jgi:hypothetical protein
MKASSARIVAAGLCLAAGLARADEVSGRFAAGGRTIEPKHAAAYAVRDARDPRSIVAEVVLSEGPVDAEQAVATLDPHTNVINQSGIGNYVLLWVRPDGKVGMNATFSESMSQYLDGTPGAGVVGGALIAELVTNTPERVAGRIRTAAPVKAMSGETYEIDVTFAAAVRRPPAGEPLGAGGGEPGKAFAALHAALLRKDWGSLRPRIGKAKLSLLEADYRSPEENRDYALEMLTNYLPKKGVKVTGGELRPAAAVLDVEGEAFAGRSALYRVRMVDEDGAWRFDDAVLAGML